MYPVCPPDCLGLGLVNHWQCCGRGLHISDFLVSTFLHFAIVQESTIVLNLQIHNGRRDTHAMAQEFQHLVRLSEEIVKKQASTYLPAHPDTILTLVVYMMKSLQELGMTYSQLSPDMHLYIQALQIKLID